MPPLIEERVAVLESEIERNRRDKNRMFGLFEDHLQKEELELKEIKASIDALARQNIKQKAYIGAALWLVSCLFIAAQAVYKYIINGNGGA